MYTRKVFRAYVCICHRKKKSKGRRFNRKPTEPRPLPWSKWLVVWPGFGSLSPKWTPTTDKNTRLYPKKDQGCDWQRNHHTKRDVLSFSSFPLPFIASDTTQQFIHVNESHRCKLWCCDFYDVIWWWNSRFWIRTWYEWSGSPMWKKKTQKHTHVNMFTSEITCNTSRFLGWFLLKFWIVPVKLDGVFILTHMKQTAIISICNLCYASRHEAYIWS